MTASNLSICVGPSLIWTQDQSYMMDQSYSKEVSALVQILIEQFTGLYGDQTPELFTEDGARERETRLEAVAVAGGGGPAERTSSLSSTKSENGQKINKKGIKMIQLVIKSFHFWEKLYCSSSLLYLIKTMN